MAKGDMTSPGAYAASLAQASPIQMPAMDRSQAIAPNPGMMRGMFSQFNNIPGASPMQPQQPQDSMNASALSPSSGFDMNNRFQYGRPMPTMKAF